MRTGIARRHQILFSVIGAVVLLIIGATAGSALLLSGAFSTAATKQHFRITYRILELGMRYSVASHADKIVVPDLQQVASIEVGHACYRQNCVQCHGAPGIARDPLGRGQLPSPSSLAQSAREWPEAHLFYITQKGVRMSGMPAWEYRISETGLWSTVAYLKAMPFMTAEDHRLLASKSGNMECPVPAAAAPYSIEEAQIALRQYSCDNCHVIRDMVGPNTRVGPSLEQWYRRKYIAGVVPNTPENLVRWIVDPRAVSPHTLMPDLDVIEPHAQIMARYLLTAPDGYEEDVTRAQ